MGTKITVSQNSGIISTGDHSVAIFIPNKSDDLKWNEIDIELDKLLNMTNSASLRNFALKSKKAVKQRNSRDLLSYAAKLGEFGLEFLKDASLNILAEIVAKAIFT